MDQAGVPPPRPSPLGELNAGRHRPAQAKPHAIKQAESVKWSASYSKRVQVKDEGCGVWYHPVLTVRGVLQDLGRYETEK